MVECKGTGADLTFDLAIKNFENHMIIITMAIIKRIQQRRKFGDRALPLFMDYDMWGTRQAVIDQFFSDGSVANGPMCNNGFLTPFTRGRLADDGLFPLFKKP
jgi:hypothetical protein